jgi:hypothetical protein
LAGRIVRQESRLCIRLHGLARIWIRVRIGLEIAEKSEGAWFALASKM